jgi:hypothetical protein
MKRVVSESTFESTSEGLSWDFFHILAKLAATSRVTLTLSFHEIPVLFQNLLSIKNVVSSSSYKGSSPECIPLLNSTSRFQKSRHVRNICTSIQLWSKPPIWSNFSWYLFLQLFCDVFKASSDSICWQRNTSQLVTNLCTMHYFPAAVTIWIIRLFSIVCSLSHSLLNKESNRGFQTVIIKFIVTFVKHWIE